MKRLTLILCILVVFVLTIRAQEIRVVGYDTLKSELDSTTVVSLKEAAGAEVYIDGIQYDGRILELLDMDKIKSITLLKGEDAKKLYDADKVIVVNTIEGPVDGTKIRSKGQIYSDGKKDGMSGDSKKTQKWSLKPIGGTDNPVFVIDGVIKTEFDLKKLSPDNISKIEVKKDEATLKKYHTNSGVVLITTKKK